MPSFTKGGGVQTPFGKNVYKRNSRIGAEFYESATVAKSTVPVVTVDGNPRKILQPGTVMAKITSGGDTGKVGPFNAAATDGRQTLANIAGVNDTFLPWQLIDRDEEISLLKTGDVLVQAWCIEYTNDTTPIPLSNTTAAAMVAAKTLNLNFA